MPFEECWHACIRVLGFILIAVLLAICGFGCSSAVSERHVIRCESCSGTAYGAVDCSRCVFDGKNLGAPTTALAFLNRFPWREGLQLTVWLPDEASPFKNDFELYVVPYYDDGLICMLARNRVQVEYLWQGKKLDVHTLSWVIRDRAATDEEENVWYSFDGKEVGWGESACAKLRTIHLNADSFVQVLSPNTSRGNTPVTELAFPDGLLKLIHFWESKSVRVEFHD